MLLPQFFVRNKARWLFAGYALCLTFLSVSKNLGYFTPELRDMQNWLGGDKHVHFIAALVLGLGATFLLHYQSAKWHLKLGAIVMLIAFFLTIDEMLQFFIKTRVFDIYDLYYGWAGLILGLILGLIVRYLAHSHIIK